MRSEMLSRFTSRTSLGAKSQHPTFGSNSDEEKMKNLIIPSACLALLLTPAFAQAPGTPATTPPLSTAWGQQTDISGTVKAFTLTPVGEIEGIVLTNGTEIHVPPHLTEQVASAVRPGEAVSVRGWNNGIPNFVIAIALTGQRGQSVVDQGPPPPGTRPPPLPPGQAAPGSQPARIQGWILQVLHGPRGDANGAMLDDGTTLRLQPQSVWQTASLLQPGQSVVAQGRSLSNSYGRVLEVESIASGQQIAPTLPAAGTAPPPPAGMAPPPPPPATPRG
jgi:hypothetical protein